MTAWEEGVEEDPVEGGGGSQLETGGFREINGSCAYQRTDPCSISPRPRLSSSFLYEP